MRIPIEIARPTSKSRRALLFVGLLLAGNTAAIRAEGVVWEDRTLEQALSKAQKTGEFVLIDIYAGHCGQCKVMDTDLWETPAGADLAEGLIPVRIASDKREGTLLQQTYPVLGLPVVIFLRPDGSEIDRVVGFRSSLKFLEEAQMIKLGSDPLPDMEAALAASPDDRQKLVDVMERYLYRKREADALAIHERLKALNSNGASSQAARSFSLLARYAEYFKGNTAECQGYWRGMVEQCPNATAVTTGVVKTYKNLDSRRRLDQWLDWICPLVEANPQAGRLNYYVARYGNKGGLRHRCLAQAARAAHALKVRGAEKYDSLAVVLAGN